MSKTGFPSELSGLKPWQRAYQKDWRYRQAFATSVVLNPAGKWVLGTSGSGHRNEFATAANYHPDLYLNFLEQSKTRGERISQILDDGTLPWPERLRRLKPIQTEIIQSLKEANNKGKFSRARSRAM